MWHTFKIFGLNVAAKVYDNPSQYGINGSRISKLDISKWDIGLLQYDRSMVYNHLPMSFVKLICKIVENMV